jgi:hypothetical protein
MKNKKITICSLVLFLISGVNGTKAQTQDLTQFRGSTVSSNNVNSQTNNQSEFTFSEKPGQSYKIIGPKVKGLSIGMRFQDAIAIIKEKTKGKKDYLGADVSIKGPLRSGAGGDPLSLAAALGVPIPPGAFIIIVGIPEGMLRADENNAVSLITLPSYMFDSASNLSLDEYTKKFMQAYGIPEFKPSEDGKNYEYTDPSGVNITIFADDKSVKIEKVASEKQIKASFD